MSTRPTPSGEKASVTLLSDNPKSPVLRNRALLPATLTAAKAVGKALRESRTQWLLLGLMLGAYTVVWSYISLARMFAFQTQVYDLGIQMTQIYGPFHNLQSWTGFEYFYFTTGNGSAYLLWPFALYPNYEALLILQSFLIGAPALLLYGIGLERLRDRNLSFGLAASYFINFEISGANWYDFHLEALFPFLFILGYYLLLRGHLIPAGVVLFLSGWVRVPYMVFPILLAGTLLLQAALQRGDWLPHPRRTQLAFAGVLLLVCLLYFVVLFVLGLALPGGVAATTTLVHQGTFFTGLEPKLLTFGLLALPFCLLLPLVRWWFLFFLPYAYLVFFVGWFHYYYPVVFTDQYLVIVVPFVYLAAIDAIRVLEQVAPKKGERRPAVGPRDRWKLLGLPYQRLGHRGPMSIVLSIVVLLALLGLYLLPYGPLNSGSPVDFAFGPSTTYNSSRYAEYLGVISYVPSSDGYVVFQENMPQLLPRPLPYNTPMSPPLSSFGTNYSIDRYPVQNWLTGRWEDAKIDYVVGEPESTQYYYWGDPSVQVISQQLYAGGYVGIVAEASGMYVLERGYHGGPKYYVPWVDEVATTSPMFNVMGDGMRGSGGVIEGPTGNRTTDEMWTLYYPFLVPGTYRVTLDMETSTLDPGNFIAFGSPTGNSWDITSAQFSQANQWTPVSEVMNVSGFFGPNVWGVVCNHWNGTVAFRYFSIEEIGPPA